MALRNECPKWATSDEALGRDGTKLYGLINRMGTSVKEWLAGV
jgi:hypothetical protein